MTVVLYVLLALGITPLIAGLVLARPSHDRVLPAPGSVVLCALAFNLTFFWQELWLVLPKAWAGLSPTLFHNDHDWAGDAPVAELLQGTGALGTLSSGVVFLILLAAMRGASSTWRMFFFWMAAHGLFQAFSQLAIGTVLSGNDMGRALAYLQVGAPAKAALLVLAAVAMAAAGAVLARLSPLEARGRAFGWSVLITLLAAVVLVVPFRVPRHPIEVVLIPLLVHLTAAGWLALGAAADRRRHTGVVAVQALALVVPAVALAVVLAVFQIVLRPGVSF
ncbi:hypothetical protein P7B02_17185 [Caulobacter segnis]|uniref:hypothetical protein n=1 Tax=Caulobacter segnis TaxID=88688 RepID=UPI0024106AA3|nr:hypothetical protein [Caulobacter segnis]MDG2523266.1 hypothetical protein [Caulobacter segnis]